MTSLRFAVRSAAFFLSVLAFLPRHAHAAEVWEAAPLTGDPKALVAAAEKVQPGNSTYTTLLYEATYTFEADGRTHAVIHEINRVATADAVEDLGTVRASWSPWFDQKPAIQARVISKDGAVQMLDPKTIVEATADEQQDMFSDERVLRAPLPGVVAGSVIETVITTDGRSPIAGGGKFAVDSFTGQIPIEHERLVLDGPTSITPHILNKANIQPRVVEQNGRRQMIFEMGHSEPFTDFESYLPSDETNLPYIAFSTGTSWKEIAKNYSDIVDTQLAQQDLKPVAAAAVGNTTDRRQIIDRLLASISSNVHYAGVEVGDGSIVPRAPKTVLANKYGDCKDKATLLVGLLRAAGIPAHVALLSSGWGFDAVGDLPGVDHFNHAIVAVDGPQPLWIDPTDDFARAGELPLEDQGRMALIASPETTALTTTPELPSSANAQIETRTITLPEDGKAQVLEVTEGTGTIDASLRRQYADTDRKSFHDQMEKYAKGYYVAASMETLDAGDPHALDKPYKLSIGVTKSRTGIVSEGTADVAIPIDSIAEHLPEVLRDWHDKNADAEASSADDKKRVHGFRMPSPSIKEWHYRIVPPAGYAPLTLPANENTKLGTVTLTTEYKAGDNGVVDAVLRLDSGKRRLTAAEYEETRVAVSKLWNRDTVHVRFEAAGQTKLNAGDVRGALAEFRKMAERHPKEAQHHIELARALLAGGLVEAARDEARLATKIEPANAHAFVMLAATLEDDLLGRAYRRGCDLPGAVAALRKAKELEPKDATIRAALALELTHGDDGLQWSRTAHLQDSAAEYDSLIKDLGKDGAGYVPSLMLVYTHMGRWSDVRALLDKTKDEQQRDLFRIIAAAGADGSAAALRELNAFDAAKRRQYGAAVGQTMIELRNYNAAADLLEAAAKGSDSAAQSLKQIELLRKTKAYETQLDDTPRALVLKLIAAGVTGDLKQLEQAVTPELREHLGDDSQSPRLNPHMFGGSVAPTVFLDIFATLIATEVQQEGNDQTGYHLRMHGNGKTLSMFVQKLDGKYVVAAVDDEEVGAAVLRLVAANQLDTARTWLNWARETISAGGGDDALAGAPFARLWQKEKAAATADEIRLAAASLMMKKRYTADALKVLTALRDSAPSDTAKTAADIAIAECYRIDHNWTALLPVAERLAKANPDSARAFHIYFAALSHSDKPADADALAQARLKQLPKDRDAVYLLSLAAAKRGDYDQAVTLGRRLIDELTPETEDYNHVAWLALFRGKEFDRAIDDVRHVTEEKKSNSGALHTLAALYAATDKNVEARQALLQSIDARTSGEPASTDWFVLGRIAENYGVRDAAVAAYKRVKSEEANGITTYELTQKRLAALNVK